ncbi:hypothetical protein [Dactylosporangium sp. NPDC049140]|uniref:hypothetical protein n=1 Tax=Dactylosporangium sp. NPDC049140 TaxID=3155647 RepID=UPI00340C0518
MTVQSSAAAASAARRGGADCSSRWTGARLSRQSAAAMSTSAPAPTTTAAAVEIARVAPAPRIAGRALWRDGASMTRQRRAPRSASRAASARRDSAAYQAPTPIAIHPTATSWTAATTMPCVTAYRSSAIALLSAGAPVLTSSASRASRACAAVVRSSPLRNTSAASSRSYVA